MLTCPLGCEGAEGAPPSKPLRFSVISDKLTSIEVPAPLVPFRMIPDQALTSHLKHKEFS